MNIAKEVRALIAATKKCLGPRPCDFLLMALKEGQSLTPEEMQLAQRSNTPILIKKHDGSFSVYGKLAGSAWAERGLNNLTVEQQKALTDLDFAKGVLKFDGALLQNQDLISALEKGHSGTIYEQSLTDMFDNLVYEGIPELKEDPFYFPVYDALYEREQDIPAEKKPGYIYLYIHDGRLHYQTQWIVKDSESEEKSPVYTGTLDVDVKLLQEAQFVDNPVKPGNAIRTLWYEYDDEQCNYSVIDDAGKKRVRSIPVTPKCNVALLALAVEEPLYEAAMQSAQKTKTPILIKRGEAFSIYGNVGGVWQERKLENLSEVEKFMLDHESFAFPFLQAHEMGDSFTHIVQKGHDEVGDTECSIREKLLVEIKRKGFCLDKKENLKKLEERFGEFIQHSGHMQPFYEKPSSISHWYREACGLETGFLSSAEELLTILEQEDFQKIFMNDPISEQLMARLKQNLGKIVLNQRRIVQCLREFENPSQLIDYLKEAYGAEFNSALYSEMTTLLFQFDSLLKEKYDSKITKFFEENKDAKEPAKLISFLASKNLTYRFSSYYVLKRPLLLRDLSNFFKKGHKRFHELALMYSAVNKSALAANKAKDGFIEDLIKKGEAGSNRLGLTNLTVTVNGEKNPLKKYMLDLILPLWTFLVLDTQNSKGKDSEKNDTAIFYLQRRILIEHLEKFRKEWTLSGEVSNIANHALAMILASGYQVVDLKLNDDGMTYAIRLGENPETEIRGCIEGKDLNGLNIPQELDLNDAGLTANILWAIARKGHIPMPRNEDIALLVEAVSAMVGILSLYTCSPPENKQALRRGRLQSSIEPRPLADPSNMETPSTARRAPARNTSIFFRGSEKYSKPPVFPSETSSSSMIESRLSTTPPSPATVDFDSFSSSPVPIDRSSSTSPIKREQNLLSSSPAQVGSDSSPEAEARSSSTTPTGIERNPSPSSLPAVDRRSSSDEENRRLSSFAETKDNENGKDKKISFREKILVKKRRGFFETEEFNKEMMKDLCLDEQNCNAFYYLACAARDGRYGVTKDPIAAYYFACLAEHYLPADAMDGKGHALVKQLIDELPPVTSIDKRCNEEFKKNFGFDPKEMYFECMRAKDVQTRFTKSS